MAKQQIIATFAAVKGGVGKTTLTYNFGEYIAARCLRVLFLDLDAQCNLTHRYGFFKDCPTVADILLDNQVDPASLIQNVKPNISIIPGSMSLDTVETQLATESTKYTRLMRWLVQNKTITDQYSFILIDTHPGFTTATKNAALISDYILCPITPSADSYSSKFDLDYRLGELRKEASDPMTGKSYVDARLRFVGNMIKPNTNSSRTLEAQLEQDPNTIAIVPDRELFNKTGLLKQSLVDLAQDRTVYLKYQAFFDQINTTFNDLAADMWNLK